MKGTLSIWAAQTPCLLNWLVPKHRISGTLCKMRLAGHFLQNRKIEAVQSTKKTFFSSMLSLTTLTGSSDLLFVIVCK